MTAGNFNEVKLFPNGKRFVNGLSNSYEASYDSSLRGILEEEELVLLMSNLNDTIQKFWPCQPCYLFGILCAPLSIIPCFPTNYCMNAAEKAAHDMLEQASLKAKYYDRQITFRLIKQGCCSSYVSITFPSNKAIIMTSASVTTPLIAKGSFDVENSDLAAVAVVAPSGHRKYM